MRELLRNATDEERGVLWRYSLGPDNTTALQQSAYRIAKEDGLMLSPIIGRALDLGIIGHGGDLYPYTMQDYIEHFKKHLLEHRKREGAIISEVRNMSEGLYHLLGIALNHGVDGAASYALYRLLFVAEGNWFVYGSAVYRQTHSLGELVESRGVIFISVIERIYDQLSEGEKEEVEGAICKMGEIVIEKAIEGQYYSELEKLLDSVKQWEGLRGTEAGEVSQSLLEVLVGDKKREQKISTLAISWAIELWEDFGGTAWHGARLACVLSENSGTGCGGRARHIFSRNGADIAALLWEQGKLTNCATPILAQAVQHVNREVVRGLLDGAPRAAAVRAIAGREDVCQEATLWKRCLELVPSCAIWADQPKTAPY